MNDELLIKYLLRETDAEEDMRVSEWIAADPSHQKQFSQIEQIWNSSKTLAAKSEVDENEAWQRFQSRAAASAAPEAKVRPLKNRFGWLRIAAALVLIAGVSWYFLANDTTTLTSGGQILAQTLPDGSEITLNKNSSVSYKGKLDGDQRNIDFRTGEAFFNVKPDKRKPFVIHADEVTIQVVGTSFNVKHNDRQTEVIVETGLVKVGVNDRQVELRPGERAILTKGSDELIKTQNPDQLYRHYRNRLFVADNTPLQRLVDVLNDAYNVNITVENPELGKKTLTSTFKEGDLDQTLKVISQTLGLRTERDGRNIVLKK